MKNNEITKREELCELLNMNFDEAGELFSDETMQSMQMAKVNGGIAPIVVNGLIWLCRFVATTAAGVAIYEFFQGSEGQSSAGPTGPGLTFNAKQIGDIIDILTKNPSDSIKVSISVDKFEAKIYGNNPKE